MIRVVINCVVNLGLPLQCLGIIFCGGGSFRIGANSSHCGDLIVGFCGTVLYSVRLDSLQLLY